MSKLLTLGKIQINLAFRSLIRNFDAEFYKNNEKNYSYFINDV
jgi:hypothetical protein